MPVIKKRTIRFDDGDTETLELARVRDEYSSQQVYVVRYADTKDELSAPVETKREGLAELERWVEHRKEHGRIGGSGGGGLGSGPLLDFDRDPFGGGGLF